MGHVVSHKGTLENAIAVVMIEPHIATELRASCDAQLEVDGICAGIAPGAPAILDCEAVENGRPVRKVGRTAKYWQYLAGVETWHSVWIAGGGARYPEESPYKPASAAAAKPLTERVSGRKACISGVNGRSGTKTMDSDGG